MRHTFNENRQGSLLKQILKTGMITIPAVYCCTVCAFTGGAYIMASGGGMLTATNYISQTVLGAGQPVGLVADTTNIWIRSDYNFTGFFHPENEELLADTDADSIPDMLDPDGDGDGISSIDELLGTYFGGVSTDTRNPDTDDDGVSDYGEWKSGTNPDDGDSVFQITEVVVNSDTDVRVRFHSIQGKTYELLRSTDPNTINDSIPVDGTTGGPGSGPFNEGTTEFYDIPFGVDYYYRVKLTP